MPRGRSGSAIENQIETLALRFADEVAQAVRSAMSAEVSAQIAAVLGTGRGAGRAAGKADRRVGRTPVRVVCPVPGCTNVGIRPKRNFCNEHAASLSEAEKKKLREAQKAQQQAGGGEGAGEAPKRAKGGRKKGARATKK